MARHAQILDHRGEPIRRDVLTEEISGPTLSGVRSIWSTHHVRDLTPARLAAILRESETPGDGSSEDYVELAEAMEERDLHYLGCLQTRKRQVAQIGVTIEPASDSAEDAKDADLVREFLGRDDLEDELIDLLDALGKSYSVCEIIWEMSENQWMPQRLEWRLPKWFDFDRVSGQRIVRRANAGEWAELEPWKFVTHIVRAKSGLPIRGGLARIVAWGWMFKNYTLRDWVRFVEAYGHPLRLGKYGRSSTPEDRAVLFRAVRQIGADMAAMIPEEMDIEFPSESTIQGRSELYKDLVTYIDNQISIAVLGQTLTTQPGESGSYALGQVHDLVRHDIERSDGRQLAATIKRDIVIPIVSLNHGVREKYPTVSIARESGGVDAKTLIEALKGLVPFGLRVGIGEVRTKLGLSPPGEDDEVFEVRPSGSADPPPAPPARARDAGGEHPSATAAAEDDADPLPALVARVREDVGPLVDGWVDRVRRAAEDAASLEEARDWIDGEGVGSLDPGEIAERLGIAGVAGELAGRYDVEARVATAAASSQHTQLPFEEQIAFFRSKVSLGTKSWTDVWEDGHDRYFVVAGAMRDELLSDLRGAVDQAISDGTTIETFRREFDDIVAKHGWTYKGGRDWRTRTIYETNLRSSYAAGRFQQMQDIADRRPYWRYRHSDASEVPREAHLRWDGLVLRHDDPWWESHYPPNGWGCKCYIETLGPRDMERLGRSGPDQAPQIRTRTVTVGEGGPTPRTVEVPEGIDPGWAYAPGRSAVGKSVRHRLDRSIAQPTDIAAAGVEAMLGNPRALAALGREWREWRVASPGPDRPETFTIGAFTPAVTRQIRGRGHAVESAAITATRRRIAHADRDRAHDWGKALGEADLDRLPEIVAHPRAVLYDRNDPGTILMVFDPVDEAAAGRAGKVVVRVDLSTFRREAGERHEAATNSFRTAGYVETHNLREPRYDLLEGVVE